MPRQVLGQPLNVKAGLLKSSIGQQFPISNKDGIPLLSQFAQIRAFDDIEHACPFGIVTVGLGSPLQARNIRPEKDCGGLWLQPCSLVMNAWLPYSRSHAELPRRRFVYSASIATSAGQMAECKGAGSASTAH